MKSRWLLIAALELSGGHFSHAAVTEAWVQRYNNVLSNQTVNAVKADFDAAGDVIVIGNTRDSGSIVIIKYSGAGGSVSWQRQYRSGGDFRIDQVKDVGVDGNDNVFVLGRSYQGIGGPSDYFTVKLAAVDGVLLWEKRHNGTVENQDFGHALAVDGEGNVAITVPSDGNEGSVDACTIMYAADGALLWENCYNGPVNGPDIPQAIAADGNGHVVVIGQSQGGPPGYNRDYFTAKYAANNGALLWERRFNGPADGDDSPKAVTVDGSGNVVVTGSSFNGAPNYDSDYYTAKYAAADGTLLWDKRYNGPANWTDDAIAVSVDGAGNVVVTGNSSSATSDYYMAKYAAADGGLLWERRHNGVADGEDYAQAMAVDSSGNVVVTGSSYNDSPTGGFDYYTASYAAANGALLWEQRYSGPSIGSDSLPVAVAVNSSDHVMVTGMSRDASPPHDDFIYTAKYAATDGALLWDQLYRGSEVFLTFARAVAADAAGNVVVTGSAYNGAPNYDSDFYTAKYAAADGALLWERRYNGPVNRDDFARAVAVDGSGNVIVTGDTTAGGANDFYTAKYAATDGALLWEKRYTGPGYNYDLAEAVTVDSNGNVVVTGHSHNGTNAEIYTAKYAAADGAVLWERRYAGLGIGASYDNHGYAVVVDGNGDVIVTGDSENGDNTDYYTAKYAATDGALLWERRYNGPLSGEDDEYGDDEARAVAVDVIGNVVVTGSSATIKYLATGTPVWTNTSLAGKAISVDGSGNVVVAGSSYNPNGNLDIYTTKSAAADGALLWERHYNGPANGDDGASTVAVDISGNVVITGGSWNGTSTDYYTAKYATTDGALLWERHYNGPANGEDFTIGSRSLALGPNGMVAITGRSANFDGNFDFATIVYRENLPAVSIALIPTGVRLRFPCVPGQSYRIERAPTVAGPWSTIATRTGPIEGAIDHTDTEALPGSAFYRAVTP